MQNCHSKALEALYLKFIENLLKRSTTTKMFNVKSPLMTQFRNILYESRSFLIDFTQYLKNIGGVIYQIDVFLWGFQI